MSIFSSFANQARLRSFGGTGGGTGASDMDILLLRSARRRDAIDHAVMIGLAGIDPRRSERGLVGRVGKFLGLQRDAVAHAVEMDVLADERAVEAVEIGRESCRERVGQYVVLSVVAVPLKTQKQG